MLFFRFIITLQIYAMFFLFTSLFCGFIEMTNNKEVDRNHYACLIVGISVYFFEVVRLFCENLGDCENMSILHGIR